MENTLRDVRVLIVDDNKLARDTTRHLLEYRCCIVDVVTNGTEAIWAVRQNPYDIILMDYCMPVMDGIQATRCIRNLEAQGMCYRDPAPLDERLSRRPSPITPRDLATSDEHPIPGSPMRILDTPPGSAGTHTPLCVPIIAYTAQVTDEVKKQCLAVGMDDFLPKPASIEQIEEKIIQWLFSRGM